MDELQNLFGEDCYHKNLQKIKRFRSSEGRYVISITPVKHNYRQLFNQNRMETLAGLQLVDLAALPGINLLVGTADWGPSPRSGIGVEKFSSIRRGEYLRQSCSGNNRSVSGTAAGRSRRCKHACRPLDCIFQAYF